MATQNEEMLLQPITMIAEGAVTRYSLGELGTAYNQVKLPGGANVECFCVFLADADDGDPVEVQPLNGAIVQMIAKSTIAYKAKVVCNGTAGKIKTATGAGTEITLGTALGATTADNDRIPVFTCIDKCKY